MWSVRSVWPVPGTSDAIRVAHRADVEVSVKPPGDEPRIIATTTLCTVEDLGDGRVDIQLGHVVFRLTRRELASLSGTLQRVVRQIFPRQQRASPAFLRLVTSDDDRT